mmetsp:Transcript_42961/g.168078  ORF Transcript_42961/g.168078 Transcript_42961/m.168078 type:complete len:90 (-) Transcript_42961:552-821(-)
MSRKGVRVQSRNLALFAGDFSLLECHASGWVELTLALKKAPDLDVVAGSRPQSSTKMTERLNDEGDDNLIRAQPRFLRLFALFLRLLLT